MQSPNSSHCQECGSAKQPLVFWRGDLPSGDFMGGWQETYSGKWNTDQNIVGFACKDTGASENQYAGECEN